MSTSTEIQDLVTPALQEAAAKLSHPLPLLQRAGERVAVDLRQHFLERDSEGNSKGYWRSNFWNTKVRAKTHFTGATDTEARVTISGKEFLHKLQGGTIHASPGKALAIPLTSEAKEAASKGPLRSSPLKLFIVKTASQVFLARLTGSGKKEAHGIEFLYVLKRSVTHAPDSRALPERGVLERGIDEVARNYMKEVLS